MTVELPETDYAVTPDGIYLAYQVVGEGPIDLVWQSDFTEGMSTWCGKAPLGHPGCMPSPGSRD